MDISIIFKLYIIKILNYYIKMINIIFYLILIVLIIIILYRKILSKKDYYKNKNIKKCIILFGLCRNKKSLDNLEIILKKYKYDTFAYINIIKDENVNLREGKCNKLVDPIEFLQKNCLKYYIEDQNISEKKINNIYLKTLNYGIHKYWNNKKELNKYLLFQLYSLDKCQTLFNLKDYDLIYCLRIDQVYKNLPLVKYKNNTIYLQKSNSKEYLFDRNYIISSDISNKILSRINYVLYYCEKFKKPIHAEIFFKWIVENNNIFIKYIKFEGKRIRCND